MVSKQFLKSIIVIAAFLPQLALAEVCDETKPEVRHGALKVRRIILHSGVEKSWRKAQENCAVMVSLAKSKSAYRTYIFTQDGMFQVGNYSPHANGSKTFFTFPRARLPNFRLLPNGEISVTTASGDEVIISTQSKKSVDGPIHIRSISGATFDENPNLNAAEDTLRIRDYHGLLLESPYVRGEAATFHINTPFKFLGKSTLSKGSLASCALTTEDLFHDDYHPVTKQDKMPKPGTMWYPIWIYGTDTKLLRFLSSETNCSRLDLSALRIGVAPAEQASVPTVESETPQQPQHVKSGP